MLFGFGFGEANILADAPSRAPWESALAMHLPIPDMPVRDLVSAMYKSPEQLTVWVQFKTRRSSFSVRHLSGDHFLLLLLGTSTFRRFWKIHRRSEDQPRPSGLRHRGLASGKPLRHASELGLGEVLWGSGSVYRDLPVFVCTEPACEKALAGLGGDRPRPVRVEDTPWILERAVDRPGTGSRHNHYIIRWLAEVKLTGGSRHSSMWSSTATLGEAEARRQAWTYFRAAFQAKYNRKTRVGVRGINRHGPMIQGPHCKFYRGQEDTHEFTVWVHSKDSEPGVRMKIVAWDPQRDTFESPEDFCGNCSF